MVEMAKTRGVALRITNGLLIEEEADEEEDDDEDEDGKLNFSTEVSCTCLALCYPR